MDLTVEDINAINHLLECEARSRDCTERKRIADLSWKLVFLGQRIEQQQKALSASSAPAGASGASGGIQEEAKSIRLELECDHVYSRDDGSGRGYIVLSGETLIAAAIQAAENRGMRSAVPERTSEGATEDDRA